MKRLAYYTTSLIRLLESIDSFFIKVVRILSSYQSKISIYKGKYKFYVRSIKDLWILKETIIDKDYIKYGFTINPGDKILDVGAFIGDYTIFAAKKGAKVTAFEPDHSNYTLLKKNAVINYIKGITLKNIALISSKSINVKYNDQILDKSMLRMNKTWELSSFSEELEKVGLIDILKLDIEGGEYDLILNTNSFYLKKYVKKIVMEFHTFNGEDEYELINHLKNTGFNVEVFPPKFDNKTGFLKAINDRFNI